MMNLPNIIAASPNLMSRGVITLQNALKNSFRRYAKKHPSYAMLHTPVLAQHLIKILKTNCILLSLSCIFAVYYQPQKALEFGFILANLFCLQLVMFRPRFDNVTAPGMSASNLNKLHWAQFTQWIIGLVLLGNPLHLIAGVGLLVSGMLSQNQRLLSALLLGYMAYGLNELLQTPGKSLDLMTLFISVVFGLITLVLLNGMFKRMCYMQHHQHQALDYYQSMAATDSLTGLLNRRQLDHRLHAEMSRSRRHQIPLSVVMLDIDHFKQLNDQYGHTVGDKILQELSQLLEENIRESDLAARYGGEEFVLVYTQTPLHEAFDSMDRLRRLIANHPFSYAGKPLQVTISAGVTQLMKSHTCVSDLLETADKGLYQAKASGRNQVIKAYAYKPLPEITADTPPLPLQAMG
jgi:diguanylate cyclase (GGDEF)-like protein